MESFFLSIESCLDSKQPKFINWAKTKNNWILQLYFDNRIFSGVTIVSAQLSRPIILWVPTLRPLIPHCLIRVHTLPLPRILPSSPPPFHALPSAATVSRAPHFLAKSQLCPLFSTTSVPRKPPTTTQQNLLLSHSSQIPSLHDRSSSPQNVSPRMEIFGLVLCGLASDTLRHI